MPFYFVKVWNIILQNLRSLQVTNYCVNLPKFFHNAVIESLVYFKIYNVTQKQFD